MSTYYYFGCKLCKKRTGVSYTRQMWGWGNANIIETFRFLMKHTDTCGEEHIYIACEHNDCFFDNTEEDISEELKHYYPFSGDWKSEINEKSFQEYQECKNSNREKLN